jgi:hypothetical protein
MTATAVEISNTLNFAKFCKQACKPGKGCRARKRATSKTSWLDLMEQCQEIHSK